MSHIYLIGFMGAGKSTVAQLVADRLGRPCVDLDRRIETESGHTTAEMFAELGEEAFRDLETTALSAVAAEEPSVVACGGGIVLRDANRAILRKTGLVVLLEVTAGEALARIGNGETRPLLAGAGGTIAATQLLSARESLYRSSADVVVDTAGKTPEQVAEEVVRGVETAAVADRTRVHVDVPGAAYDVVIAPGALAEVGTRIREVIGACRVALITDSNVAELLGPRVDAQLAAKGFSVVALTFEAGEASKNWAVAGELLEACAQHGVSRTDCIVALGGGVVGDLAGFAAATYLRGIAFVQVPTTLLAQVDSSVGGKTGVDLRAGKNLAGAFKQPRLVIADTDVLATLPDAEWRSGLAEVAKSGVLDGEGFLGMLEAGAASLVAREAGAVEEAVRRSVAFKAGVVARDEHEEGPRECLNYGHTLGHAIERVAGYGVIPHGVAVAEGMRFAVRISAEALGTERAFIRRQDALLDALGLPALSETLDPEALLRAMHSDKKAREGVVRMVLVHGPGAWRCEPVADAIVREHLEAWAASKKEA